MADDQYDDSQDTGGDAQQAMTDATPQEVDAHRGMIGNVLGQLQGQGVDTQALASQAGVGTTDPSQMSHGDLLSMAQTLAQQHPEILQSVAGQFPQAQGLINMITGGGGGGIGGMLGKLFGG